MEWHRRHVLGLSDFHPEEMEFVIDTARSMEEVLTRDIKKVPALRGKTVVNLFFEASTRTRSSFELAEKLVLGMQGAGHAHAIHGGCFCLVVLARLYPFERRLPEFAGNRCAKPGANQKRRRLRLCLPENQILFLHDRSQDGRPLCLRNTRRASVEAGAAE